MEHRESTWGDRGECVSRQYSIIVLGKPLELTKTQDRVGREIMSTSWTFQSPMVGGSTQRIPGLPGICFSSILCGFLVYGQCHSHSGWAFPPYLPLSTNTHRHIRSVLNQSAEAENQEGPSQVLSFLCGPCTWFPAEVWPGGPVGAWVEEQQIHPVHTQASLRKRHLWPLGCKSTPTVWHSLFVDFKIWSVKASPMSVLHLKSCS